MSVKIRHCKTCGLPLWIVWLTLSYPWKKRLVPYKEATDCVHLLAHDFDIKKGSENEEGDNLGVD